MAVMKRCGQKSQRDAVYKLSKLVQKVETSRCHAGYVEYAGGGGEFVR